MTFRRTKQSASRKYPYVGHYDPAKKSKRTWCSLNEKQLNSIEFIDGWYQNTYASLIREARVEIMNNGNIPKLDRLIVRAGKLLEENGYLKNRIGEKIICDISCLVLEKSIHDTLNQKWKNS